jgi:hypothetical protein
MPHVASHRPRWPRLPVFDRCTPMLCGVDIYGAQGQRRPRAVRRIAAHYLAAVQGGEAQAVRGQGDRPPG